MAMETHEMRFHGEHLAIDDLTDVLMAHWFPEVDRTSEYRSIDSWLHANPRRRPKNLPRFLHNWFMKCKRADAGKVTVYQDGVRCRVDPRTQAMEDGAKVRLTSRDRGMR